MRLAAYAGTSMVLATGVIIRAIHERANFYSACVYLASSNACLMRLFYGPLRPIEVEQLYEKAWFAITETCLAMTIFREEVGGWFLVMFVCLLIGKVWGWIGEGRVEILEQQPPSNPRLFHARLSVSLIISTLFDIFMLRYSINTVLLHARPNMMVMFAFEFAVLTITSISTAARYMISLREAAVIKNQIKDRRAQMRRDRASAQPREPTADGSTSPEAHVSSIATDDDIDSLDIDVPGWEEKGRWVFYLDLATDFFKLVLYLTFFCVLCMFYGMPIHIIRDVALTIRSFYKRITDFVRYRQATRDMNARYPDAIAEEIAREDVCIICREEMMPWQAQATAGAEPNSNGTAAIDERLRPKKLPCGHILHFACLRSWLERQQNCPTCRRPVLMTGTVARSQDQALANQHGRALPHVNQPQAQVPAHGDFQQPVAAQNVFHFGPLRIAFGARQGAQGAAQQVNNNAPPPTQPGQLPATGNLPRAGGMFGFQRQVPGSQTRTVATFSPTGLQLQLHQMEHQLVREINSLRVQQNQLYLVRALQGELTRLRIAQATPDASFTGQSSLTHQPRVVDTLPQAVGYANVFGASPQQQSVGSSHSSLPAGMTLPPGWSILPLQRLSDGRNAILGEISNADSSSVQSQPSGSNASTGYVSQDRSQTSVAARMGERSSGLPGETQSHSSNGEPVSGNRGDISPGTPRWGSGSGYQVPNDAPKGNKFEISEHETNSNDEAKGNDSGPMSQTIADSRQIKGKGKATTVEDTTEELD
ncbi:hypothetical protein HO133_004555 [Letharia lupina]|uniref:RING-type E3 ubiquitin transferase n=1 Tax=Letharia lupina TaxID=560253 RepID=A0A8H6FKI7_9LECA|nr:uncharacterized protein HO133_004555 [Letharia lupina]KAF6230215.1 hypothetical protein HO133_004555 [Letharia lupina]